MFYLLQKPCDSSDGFCCKIVLSLDSANHNAAHESLLEEWVGNHDRNHGYDRDCHADPQGRDRLRKFPELRIRIILQKLSVQNPE